jgi:multiple sugar transport system substrate-binding protein
MDIRERITGGTSPAEDSRRKGKLASDIIGLDQHWLGSLIQNDALEPLDRYLGETEFSLPIAPDGTAQNRALPLVSFMTALFYNIDILRQAGFNRPPKTRSEFIAYAKALTAPSEDRFGFTLSLSPQNPEGIYRDVFSWVWASGEVLTREGKLDFTAPPFIETLDFFRTLYRNGHLSPGIFSKTEDDKRREFFAGRIGMMTGSIADINIIREQNPRAAFGITTIPGPDSYIGSPPLSVTSWYAGISRRSEHKDEAWAFLSFLVEQGPLLTAKAHGIPVSGGGVNYTEQDPLYSKAADIYEAGEVVREFLEIPALDILEIILRDELQAMFEQDRSPEDTALAIQRRWGE